MTSAGCPPFLFFCVGGPPCFDFLASTGIVPYSAAACISGEVKATRMLQKACLKNGLCSELPM